MMQLSTKEHLAYFMQCGMMRLSNYDLKFVQNIHTLTTLQKAITTNQVALFDKLVIKYARQLKKQNLELSFVQGLPWTTKIIQSEAAYTDAFISIADNKVILRAPFNKNFIQNFRQLDYNPFEWVRDNKRYEAPYSTIALKILVQLVHLFYPIVHYCPIVSDLLNTLQQYDSVKVWEPTLLNINGNYIIGGITEPLHEATKDITIDDHLKTLSTLTEYGIGIGDNILEDENKLRFVSQYVVELETEEIDSVIGYLKELECDCIYFSGHSLLIKKELKTKMANICTNQFNLSEMPYNKKIHNFNYPIAVQFSSTIATSKIQLHEVKKIIKIKNSNPIQIK